MTTSCELREMVFYRQRTLPTTRCETPAPSDAIEFLQSMLDASPVRVTDLFDEAHTLGLTDITLRRAKAALGVQAFATPTDKGKEWFWQLRAAA
jgi:hypothetical protein